MAKAEAIETIDALGLEISSKFIPFSVSRNKGNKYRSLNWEVTLHHKGGAVLTALYSAGEGHCPSHGHKDRAERHHMVAYECERGFKALGVRWGSQAEAYGAENERNAIKPNALDVLYSLAMDADALEYSGFEDWASSLGFDGDSRTAERTYLACLDIALKLRSALGEEGLTKLREAFQDY